MRGPRVLRSRRRAPGGDHVLVRGGRAGLSSFFWLPGGYGDVVADTGLTRAMVAPEKWKKIDAHDLGATRATGTSSSRRSWRRSSRASSTTRRPAASRRSTTLKKAAKDPEDLAELLAALRPIARGTPAEIALVEAALAMPSPAVQRAAVAVAGAAAQRRDVYHDTLAKALTSPDPELRRIAFASVRSLGERGHALFAAALATRSRRRARRELLVEVSAATTDDDAVGRERDRGARPMPTRRRRCASARRRRSAARSRRIAPRPATALTTALVAQDRAPVEARVFAIELLRDLDPLPKIAEPRRGGTRARSLEVRRPCAPRRCRCTRRSIRSAPAASSRRCSRTRSSTSRCASPRRSRGARSRPRTRTRRDDALDRMLKDEDNEVRAAAATAAGKARPHVPGALIKMAKDENYVVRIGAARGPRARAPIAGGNVGVAIGGIAQLWREKGRPRRDAAQDLRAPREEEAGGGARLPVRSAARTTEDPALHPIGVEGLCNAALAGSAEARRALARSTDDPSRRGAPARDGVRRRWPGAGEERRGDRGEARQRSDGEIRGDAARVLAMSVGKGSKVRRRSATRSSRCSTIPIARSALIAIRAIGGLGADAPKAAATAMAKLFERADEGEKLALLRTAQADRCRGSRSRSRSPMARRSCASRPSTRRSRRACARARRCRPRSPTADPQVRKAALERLAAQKDKLEPAVLDRALALAVRDPNPELSQLALTTIARVAPKEAVVGAAQALARVARRARARAGRRRGDRPRRSRRGADRAAARAAARRSVARRARRDAAGARRRLREDERRPRSSPTLMRDSETQRDAPPRRRGRVRHARRAPMPAARRREATLDEGRPRTGRRWRARPRSSSRGLIAGKADGMAFLQELVP